MNTRNFTRYAWFVTGYTVLVILWGALVRATGSGAGCGNHWPTCNGAIIPRPEQIETLIEFSHRLSSGLSGIFVLALVIWAFRGGLLSRFTRWMTVLSFVFVLLEGGIGAALVRFDLVADNASAARAVVIALHLINTYLLLGVLTLTAWSSGTGQRIRLAGQRTVLILLGIALLATIVLSTAGAITALGDTLFPPGTLAEGFQQDLDPTASFLVRLRVIHPLIAITTGIYLLVIAGTLRKADPGAGRYVRAMQIIVVTQLVAGFINVALLAPVWMQLIHLLLADSLWIALMLIASTLLAAPVEAAADPAPLTPKAA